MSSTPAATPTSPPSSPISIIETPTAADLLTDHSSDIEDPMTSAHSNIIGADFEMITPPTSSPSSTPAESDDDDDDFEEVSHTDADAAALHEQHILSMVHHIVPPYPIFSQHARIQDIVNQPSRTHQLRRYELCMRTQFGGKWSKEALIERFPRGEMKIVHMKGETHEVPKVDTFNVCDETCPKMLEEGWLKKFARDVKKIEFLDKSSRGL